MNLESRYTKNHHLLSPLERELMEEVIHNFKFGASAPFKHKPEPLWAENSDSLQQPEVARAFTDNICSWLKCGYLAGPFDIDKPPFPNLHINQVFAVEQPDKFRNIINMSYPRKRSYNDAVDKSRLHKVSMTNPREVSQAVRRAGTSGVMSKMDMKDAYKLIPVSFGDLHYQGFIWMGKIFIEKMLMFGSQPAVPTFDVFHDSVVTLVRTEAATNPDFEYRILDDMLFISPTLDENQKFVAKYLEIAEDLNIPLAPSDGKKAFICQQQGIMLGVFFDAETQSWTLPADKCMKYMTAIITALSQDKVSKLCIQRLNGIINFVCLICPPLRFFRAALVNDMRRAYSTSPLALSQDTKDLLHFWLHILHHLKISSMPIPHLYGVPPLDVAAFVSDAAGYAAHNTDASLTCNIGTGFAAYLYPASAVFTCGRAFWSPAFITTAFDDSLKAAGSKTTTLELCGWILPLFHCISLIKNSHVVIECDNVGSVFAFRRGRSKEDDWASTILTAIMEVCFEFNIYLHVYHLKRCSNSASRYADWLSRDDEKGRDLITLLNTPVTFGFPPAFLAWMDNPHLDTQLGAKLITDFKNQLRFVYNNNHIPWHLGRDHTYGDWGRGKHTPSKFKILNLILDTRLLLGLKILVLF